MPYKYDKGQRVFTADSVKKNKPPYTILRRVPYGNQPMREDHPNFEAGNKIGKPIIDPATGKTQRTPYEPGYQVRYDGDDGFTEFQIPESAIKGDVEMARGGRVKESPEDIAQFNKLLAMHKAIGGMVKKFDDGGAAFGIYPKAKGGEDLRSGGEYAGEFAKALGKLTKDQSSEELASLKKPRAVTDLLNRGVLANNPLSAMVDLVNMGLVPLDVLGSKLTGRDIKVSSDKPFLGSEYVKDLMNKYNVTSGEERPMMETALSFASPAGMIKGAMVAPKAVQKAGNALKDLVKAKKARGGLTLMR
jgi:hypothetical protein